MKIRTKYFGEISYDDSEVIHFPNGIFGFEDNASFIIIRFDNDNDGFLCLQSITNEMLAFVILNPFYVDPEYDPKFIDEDLESIEAASDTPVCLYAITTVRDNFLDSTINLKCPIIVNSEKKLAAQVILDAGNYSLRHPIVMPEKED